MSICLAKVYPGSYPPAEQGLAKPRSQIGECNPGNAAMKARRAMKVQDGGSWTWAMYLL